MSTALTSTRSLREIDTVKELLANTNAAKQLQAVAASHLNPERLMRVLALAVSKTPALATCTPMSLLGAMMTSYSLGLEVNTVMGHAYLLPFKNGRLTKEQKRDVYDAQLVIGYRGYEFLAANAGVSIYSAIHYSSDPVWKWPQGASPDLVHESGDESGDMEHAYAVGIQAKSGFKTWVCWPEAKLVAHRDRFSKGYANDIRQGKTATSPNVNIWIADPALARRKTMIRQLAKAIPLAVEMARAEAVDGARVDYARFAMDPSSGTPEPAQVEHLDADVVEEEATETDAVEQKADAKAENTAGAAALAEARAKAAAAAARPKQNRTDNTPYVERGVKQVEEQKPAEKAAPAKWAQAAADARNSMLDLPPARAAEVIDLLTEEEVTAWKAEDPEGWAVLMSEITEREASADESDD